MRLQCPRFVLVVNFWLAGCSRAFLRASKQRPQGNFHNLTRCPPQNHPNQQNRVFPLLVGAGIMLTAPFGGCTQLPSPPIPTPLWRFVPKVLPSPTKPRPLRLGGSARLQGIIMRAICALGESPPVSPSVYRRPRWMKPRLSPPHLQNARNRLPCWPPTGIICVACRQLELA